MNVLSDNNNNNNVGTPSFDLSKFGDIPIPWWVDWIANNKDAIIEVAKTLGIMFGTATVLKWLGNLGKLIGIGGGMTGLNGILLCHKWLCFLSSICFFYIKYLVIVIVNKQKEQL